MEIKSTIRSVIQLVRFCLCAWIFLIVTHGNVKAQKPFTAYSIKNGKMYIEVGKHIKEAALDSFIQQYDLADLSLKYFLKTNRQDSLKLQGWNVEVNNETAFVISKSLEAADKFDNPADLILFTEKHPTFAELFPSRNNGIVFGVNKFHNKEPFTWKGSKVTFYLRNNTEASRVMLAGSFNNWNPDALRMTKTDSGWIAEVKLEPGKYWYKFIVDGSWTIDRDNNLKENDGRGNINSVYYRPNVVFAVNTIGDAKKVFLAGSFNNWRINDLAMNKTGEHSWELPLFLEEGTHTYKFIADGKWYTDEQNKERLPDGHGGYNSVLRMGKPYIFRLYGYEQANQVVLSGTFNGWKEDELYLEKTANGWALPYTLGPGNYEYKFIVDGKWMTDPANPVTVKNNKNEANSFLIIEPNYTFRLKGYGNAKQVYLAGDFNNWSPNSLSMKRVGEDWVFQVHLTAGKHLYKFIADDKWIIDPDNKLWEQNEYGNGNSVIWIDK